MSDNLIERVADMIYAGIDIEVIEPVGDEPRQIVWKNLPEVAAQIIASLPPPVPEGWEVFGRMAYMSSGPHLSGYRVSVGFETLEDAQAAHSFLADLFRRAFLDALAPVQSNAGDAR